jgi:threonine/homoserine efflux transporter RhtA
VGTLAGWVLLGQHPGLVQVPGVLLVVAAGAGAARGQGVRAAT